MGLPLQNVDGYRNSSAINFAEGLQGSLLLVHGSGDDNVHYSGSELLINRLIELAKPVDFMEYPNRTPPSTKAAVTHYTSTASCSVTSSSIPARASWLCSTLSFAIWSHRPLIWLYRPA